MAKTFVDELWDSTEEMRKTALHGKYTHLQDTFLFDWNKMARDSDRGDSRSQYIQCLNSQQLFYYITKQMQ